MLGIPSALFIFLFNTLKSTERVLSVDLFEAEHPKRYKKDFFNP